LFIEYAVEPLAFSLNSTLLSLLFFFLKSLLDDLDEEEYFFFCEDRFPPSGNLESLYFWDR
jgi:hypothetical protein